MSHDFVLYALHGLACTLKNIWHRNNFQMLVNFTNNYKEKTLMYKYKKYKNITFLKNKLTVKLF